MVKFQETLFTEAVKIVIGSEQSLAPILERFSRVTVLDSSVITLPDSMRERFPGCGGSYGGGAAAMKLQTELDLRSGAISHVQIEPGRSPDGATSRQDVRREPKSLRITDLGYFSVSVFAELDSTGAYFLSRLQFGTSVLLLNGTSVELLPWLTNQPGPFVDRQILLGKEQQLACRLIAWRAPEAVADRRRQKLSREMKHKYGKQPSAERLAWCDWTILVTNVPPEMLTSQEAVVLYRARWQVELLFKRWKSQGLVAELTGSTETRQLVRLWARLLVVLIQHWILLATVWGDPTKSLSKACETIRSFAGRITAALPSIDELQRVLSNLKTVTAKTCRRDKRKKTGTFELLNDPSCLDFQLT
jgi:hypothetical protein